MFSVVAKKLGSKEEKCEVMVEGFKDQHLHIQQQELELTTSRFVFIDVPINL